MQARVRWLIAGACVVTVLLAQEGLRSIWELAGFASGTSAFWFCDALPMLLVGLMLVVAARRSRLPRLLRVAVALPLLHVIAVVAVALLWLRVDRYMAAHDMWAFSFDRPPLPSVAAAVVTGLVPIVVGLLIQRKRGEWAHASVMFSLSFLLLVGLWLPVVSWDWLDVNWHAAIEYEFSRYFHWQIFNHHVDPSKFLAVALLPPLVLASAYTWISFHRRALIARHRGTVRTCLCVLFGAAVLATYTMTDSNALIYLAFAYVLLIAVVQAAVSLVALTAIMWLRSTVIYRRLAHLKHITGTIIGGEGAITITSWLRGPRIDAEPLIVSTPSGQIPVSSAELLAPVASTLALEIGEQHRVLRAGDRVTLGIERTDDRDGHPFRAGELGSVAMIAAPGAERYRFSDVALVVWRPACAYLAILIAVAAPAVIMILS